LNPSSRYLAINKEEYKQRVCDALGSSFGFLVWVPRLGSSFGFAMRVTTVP